MSSLQGVVLVGGIALALAGAGCSEEGALLSGAEHELALGAAGGPQEGARSRIGFVPLHLAPADLLTGAPDLTLLSDTTIDTTFFTINGETSPWFVQRGDYAVLFTNALTVRAAVTVVDGYPLIVVAEGHVLITSPIDLSAVGTVRGPGSTFDGSGGVGTSFVGNGPRESGGGGGGGFGSDGAPGGGQPLSPPGEGGAAHSFAITDPLVGGAPGGNGGFAGGGTGKGGGGGGALQITSASIIAIGTTQILANGGGGLGGGGTSVGGGGGGTGGQIVLEAPVIAIVGTLAANGGGGGGGGGGEGGVPPQGLPGADGSAGLVPAAGGQAGVPQGSAGGTGATAVAAATAGANDGSKGGGGGGGVGRIWLRYRAATPPKFLSASISPAPGFDPSLP